VDTLCWLWYDVVVSCNGPSCSMKGGESEFFKQDCAAFS
jgi:hypothetical protein